MTVALPGIEPERVAEIAARICAARPIDGTEEAAARAIAEILDVPGVEVELEYVLPGRPNLIATVRGTGRGPGLLLNGHLDIYLAPGWSRDPHEPWIADGRLYGAAITDMNGALAAMVAAVEAAATLPELPGDLVFLGSMHHDTVALGVKYAMATERDWPRYAICGEPSCLEAHVGNGGAAKFEVVLTGRQAHISRRDNGIDALAAAVDLATALRTLRFTHEPCAQLPDMPRLLVGELHAGVAPGTVADRAVLGVDLRTVPGMTPASVIADVRALVESVCPPNVGAEITITANQRPFVAPTSGPLIDALEAAHQRQLERPLEVTSRMPGQSFITDAADLLAAGIETVVYGPTDWHYVPDESASIAELADAATVYLDTALSL